MKIERLIEKDNLSSHVFLAGWCTQEQIKCYLEESLALVLASKSEGIPIAILEAFAFGRIAIATDVGGVGELVETHKTGWLTPPNEMYALYAAISACLAAKHGELQLLADAARDRVLDYDIKKSASALDKIFLENTI